MDDGKQRTALIVTLVVSDGLAVMAALLLAYYLRLGSGILPYTSPHETRVYLRMTLLALPTWLLLLAANHLYHYDRLLGGPDEYTAVIRGCTYGVVALIVLSYFERRVPLSRGWLLASWVLAIVAVGGTRFLIRRAVFRLWRRGRLISRAVIVGTDEQAKAIARQLHPPSSSGVEVVGFVDDFLPIGTHVLRDLQVLASPASLPVLTKEKCVSEIIAVPQAMAWESFQEIVLAGSQTYNGARVRISPGLYELLTTGGRVDHKAFVPLLTPAKARITGVDALLKLTVDFTLVLVGAVLWVPTLALLIVLKRLTTPGPVFRRQSVLGQRGRMFAAVTLSVDPTTSARNDTPTELGKRLDRFLLYTGLYRLPQLIHVLSGQMSLVGPRPVPASYGNTHRNWLHNIMTVKPGITGPWVLAGTAQEPRQEERRLDMYYIRNWTIWLDLQMLIRSLVVMVREMHRPGHRFDGLPEESGKDRFDE